MSFLDLHSPSDPLLLPNAWDAGSARLMQSLGARAVATTSSGFAATLGRRDGAVSLDEALEHAAALVAAVDVPVTADLEHGYADPATTYARAVDGGLAGASIEDWDGSRLLDAGDAAARVAAARQAAPGLVLTARAEGYLHDRAELPDVVDRLQAYAEAGADVVYSPGIVDLSQIRTLVREVSPTPVNALLLGGLTIAGLRDAGIARISVGGALAWTAWHGAAAATRAFLAGQESWLGVAHEGRAAAVSAIA